MVLIGEGHGAGHGARVGYVRAGVEAAMVGGLADWFAVTALVRHPLGLPVSHTVLLPRQTGALAGQLGGFVTEHFLTPEAIHERVRLKRQHLGLERGALHHRSVGPRSW